MNHIANVTVLGTGVLGAQIAYQSAFRGLTVTAYDINEAALDAARDRFARLAHTYLAEVKGATHRAVQGALDRIALTDDLRVAAEGADLVIEAIPEVLSLKRDTFAQLDVLAPAQTIFATNSSTLLPSDLVDSTGRPDRFLALHFANRVWQFNTAEVMGTASTDTAVIAAVERFAADIGMVPIVLHKEKAGYVLNSLLVPLLNSALALAARGYAEIEDVDKTWRIATGAPLGPFQMFDIIGLNTPYNILANGSEGDRELAAWLKKHYIDEGKLGVATGAGFYTYA
ncbi:3-hydroxyacyl-CoA dehydrogenase [Micrococcus luteus]|uniref:3-hydroxyacyl-CoA dehydrogenase n=1 Tax=Micrococcus TaxID=1269 RepID=UPI0007AB5FEC|nr:MULTISPECIES: 3-hydroxyacyl-CoA dehydrogenase [Micrococcus]KZE67044.1 3-hydroxybutyryl-CoA dehydrogenase [Micrococcus aloeverae]MCV7472733.1 3-hydroxyacyl-CoA dehydrogenase [Micrococcus luteus]MEB2538172.1 3-hydroxyacyl-CoA dehydrogenase [Micrococcus luteus]